jgi:hypothetical protein
MNRPPVQQALLLLAAALPDLSPTVLAELSVGRRDAYLLTLRDQLFGPQLASVIHCPVCNQKLEFTCYISDIRAQANTESKDQFTWREDEYEVHYRLPNSLDISALASQVDTTDEVVDIQQQLFDRCMLSITHNGEEISTNQLASSVAEKIVHQMAQKDPQADVQLALSCVACEHHWSATFDIITFLWAEINAWAIRTLNEVHQLARAYSWREADILGMSAWRRRFYLNLVEA